MAHRHAGIDHQVVGEIEEGPHGLVEGDPGLLMARIVASGMGVGRKARQEYWEATASRTSIR
jgi:hypothetical protein